MIKLTVEDREIDDNTIVLFVKNWSVKYREYQLKEYIKETYGSNWSLESWSYHSPTIAPVGADYTLKVFIKRR